jgi:hypothetical protein
MENDQLHELCFAKSSDVISTGKISEPVNWSWNTSQIQKRANEYTSMRRAPWKVCRECECLGVCQNGDLGTTILAVSVCFAEMVEYPKSETRGVRTPFSS